MGDVRASVICLAALFVVGVSAVYVPVTTRYITTELVTLAQSEEVTLIGYLCGLVKGDGMNITMVLNNNPSWNLNEGVVAYYVVDAENKTKKDAICANDNGGNPGPYCTIRSWPSEGDMFIKGQAGPVEGISFTVDAEKLPKPSRQQKKQSPAHSAHPQPVKTEDRTVYLTEIITLTASQFLPRLQEAHLNFTFCPSPATGSRYTIISTVFGLDGESSYAQYICDQYPCELKYPKHIVAYDGRELPSNTVTTPSGRWEQMYALIVCWGGPYDPNKKQFIGHFQFTAVAQKSEPHLGF